MFLQPCRFLCLNQRDQCISSSQESACTALGSVNRGNKTGKLTFLYISPSNFSHMLSPLMELVLSTLLLFKGKRVSCFCSYHSHVLFNFRCVINGQHYVVVFTHDQTCQPYSLLIHLFVHLLCTQTIKSIQVFARLSRQPEITQP